MYNNWNVSQLGYNLYDDLEVITTIHESIVYGGFEVNSNVKDEFFKRLKKIWGKCDA